MHECPYCGMACDCDGEDTWLSAPDDCECDCDCLDEEENDIDIDYDEWDGSEYKA